jgi:single-strand selective monofunctional uracil DNA glycosylase
MKSDTMQLHVRNLTPVRPNRASQNTRSAWGNAWRRSASRWEGLAAPIASATGWRVWNPGRYGERWHSLFRRTYPVSKGGILVFGLNPGPYGMAQTGIPFTDIKRLEGHLPALAETIRRRAGRLQLPGLVPRSLHPYLSRTFESSAVRVYRFLALGWGSAEEGWRNLAVANGCSLLFIDPSGENRTPADLYAAASRTIGDKGEARQLLERCLQARCLAARDAARALSPRGVVLLGKDTQRALGEEMDRLLGAELVLGWEHPARAVPDQWARGLLAEIARRGWRKEGAPAG